ncbi:zinc finger and SCAN domain-containing protein 12 isoform X2 [Salmo salar]|uniref:Zinc finger and SCAN domain-containing protein 12 isoform X2 n=1 Tax=Salmo salar TaxID=8030 RepID=A0A1S3RE60_SALSA|nr:zinc finger and SCAN domain-containing protein 12-like isoform X2 [Salmo salar]
MSVELSFRSRVSTILETLTEKALQDICQLMGETCAALRVEMLHEQNQRSTKSQVMENVIGKEKPANCTDSRKTPGLRNFSVLDQIRNEQEANGIWQERDPTVEDKSPPSLVPEGEEPAQPLSQTTDMGMETLPVPLLIKQEDDDMESQGYGEWIPETHKANQNIRGESDEDETSPASAGSKELGLDDFKGEQSPLLVSTEDTATPIKKKYNNIKMYGKIETKKGTMTSHMTSHKHTGLPFSCDICGEKFKLRDFLTRHKRSNHYTGIIYSCSVCEKTFLQATSRDTHERGHTGKNYWCSDCGETFKERQERDTHECIVYKGDRPFSCSECNKDFERQYHLKKHQLEKHPLMVDQTVHYKSRCSVCGKVFMYIKWLIKHERTHREKNERRDRGPHESIVEDPINKQLESKDLEGQLESVESSEAPIRSEMIRYTCEICGTTWATKSSMRRSHGLRNFPVVDQILNEQEANGIWLERDPTVEDKGPPSLVPEGEETAQPLSQTTDMGVETLPVSPVIKQEDDDDNMESQGYSVWIRDSQGQSEYQGRK